MSRWIDNGPVDRLDMVNRVAEDIDIALYRDFLSEGEGCGLRPLREQQPDQAAAEGIA